MFIPQPRANSVLRTELINRLNNGPGRKLTLISAPAGFGKTTLLSEWIAQIEIPVAWFSLDANDNDPNNFISYLVAALRNIQNDIGESTLNMIQSPRPPGIASILTNLIREITDIHSDLVLVLDDYQLIDEKRVHTIIEFLIDHLPPQIHIVISTRVDPPMPLARLRVQNQLTELRATDLCFSVDEATLFFNKIMNLGLSNQEISILESRTEGWIAGLQLAALSMQGRKDISAFIKTFAGDDRYIVDYLAEEVLNLQPEPVREFLLQTSILDRLSGPLCDFVTGSEGSQQILNDLERSNLFIISLDNKRYWYRYHHLFADLLLQRLRQTQMEKIPTLHNRACEWCMNNGFIDEAIEHKFRSEDFEEAANLIEEHSDTIWKYGEHAKFRRWLEEIPPELLLSKPQLCIFHAWYQFASGQQDSAEKILQTAESIFDPENKRNVETSQQEVKLVPNSDVMKLRGRAAAIRAFMATYRGDVKLIIKYARKALEYLPGNDLAWRSTSAISLGDAHGFEGDMTAEYKARVEAAEACKAAGDICFYMIASLKVAITLRAQGRLKETVDLCRENMQFADENGLTHATVVGWLLSIWGEVLAEFNELDEALQYVKRGVKLTEHGADMAMNGWSQLCLIRVLFSRGDLKEAEEAIQKMNKIAKESEVPPWIINQIAYWQTRIWLMQNRMEAAIKWAAERELETNWESKTLSQLDFFLLSDYIVLARIYIAQGKWDKTSLLLDKLLERAESGGRTSKVIEILLLQALAFQGSGDITKAMASLGKTIILAEPEGPIRVFIDEGQLISELLEKILDTDIDVPRAYVKKLLSAFRLQRLVETDSGYMEQLSERELEVLRLVAGGLSNKQIMEELFLSLSTVKTHIRNIYSKLNAHSRTEVTVKARELTLL